MKMTAKAVFHLAVFMVVIGIFVAYLITEGTKNWSHDAGRKIETTIGR